MLTSRPCRLRMRWRLSVFWQRGQVFVRRGHDPYRRPARAPSVRQPLMSLLRRLGPREVRRPQSGRGPHARLQYAAVSVATRTSTLCRLRDHRGQRQRPPRRVSLRHRPPRYGKIPIRFRLSVGHCGCATGHSRGTDLRARLHQRCGDVLLRAQRRGRSCVRMRRVYPMSWWRICGRGRERRHRSGARRARRRGRDSTFHADGSWRGVGA
jgi:hypothetical protein